MHYVLNVAAPLNATPVPSAQLYRVVWPRRLMVPGDGGGAETANNSVS